ncbi:hypothetical protein DEO72_LG7g941 [Vigna unguiculata]|uniref:Uncharacterized protein n=1 Tax=Vigna unguiculata TaxID=3917 RepID=A0A4D6MF73_VIGUN|nr:hypothetical protein DEO72_LG7g941 [Vigna unguiculata]
MKSCQVSIILSKKFDQPNDDISSPSSSIFSNQTSTLSSSVTGTCLRVAKIATTPRGVPVCHAHFPPLSCRPLQGYLCSTLDDNTICIWDATNGDCVIATNVIPGISIFEGFNNQR